MSDLVTMTPKDKVVEMTMKNIQVLSRARTSAPDNQTLDRFELHRHPKNVSITTGTF